MIPAMKELLVELRRLGSINGVSFRVELRPWLARNSDVLYSLRVGTLRLPEMIVVIDKDSPEEAAVAALVAAPEAFEREGYSLS